METMRPQPTVHLHASGEGGIFANAYLVETHGPHSYLADGKVLAWLANLERARPLLAGVPTLYPGHGRPGPGDLLERQREYLLAYCAAVKDLADGRPALTDAAKKELTARMKRIRPDAGLEFLIAQSADAVAAELAGAS